MAMMRFCQLGEYLFEMGIEAGNPSNHFSS